MVLARESFFHSTTDFPFILKTLIYKNILITFPTVWKESLSSLFLVNWGYKDRRMRRHTSAPLGLYREKFWE